MATITETDKANSTQTQQQDSWTLVIRPKRRWLEINLKELWHYRDLYVMYIKRDFITLYKQTILGPLWFLIQPLMTTLVYMFVFGGLAGLSTDGVPQPLFYMSGVMLWGFFSSSFLLCTNVFVSNAALFGKVYFPRLIVPLATVTSNMIKMGIQLLLFVAMYIVYWLIGAPLQVNAALLLFPVLMVMLAFHAVSWGLIVSSLTSKYRDLSLLVGFVVQLFMYATPVVYPLSAMPDKYKPLMELNPLTSIFEAFKYGCMGCGALDWGGLLYSFVFMVAGLFFSVIIFNRVERNFMDTV